MAIADLRTAPGPALFTSNSRDGHDPHVEFAKAPYYYSHLGSRDICMMTIVQNLSQARKVWGQDGVKRFPGYGEFPLVRRRNQGQDHTVGPIRARR
ncbi:hypothetical protein CH273_14330 [Rhodococcus sp. 05-339-2]|uniref:TraM recognition domain-containing protein n=1 Tax=Rhodococcoides fascians TaxID=1828 RepID=UPI00050CE68F|nr:hypothetical protein CH273_14330 [Rhodococcus sp. 05-339-2]